MANCDNIAFDRIEDRKVYLKGVITGLDSSKKYCVYYLIKTYVNLHNDLVHYTYLTKRTSFDLESRGCYLPDMGYSGYKIFVWEIGVNCEDRKNLVCIGTVDVVADETKIVNFRVRDSTGSAVSGVKITVGGERHPIETLYTDGSGRASTGIKTRMWCTARCVPGSDWGCVDCYERWFHSGDMIIDFEIKGDTAVVPPVPEPPKPECTDGDKKPGKVCVNGHWEDALCTEGTYTADRKKICRGGAWVSVGEEPVEPGPPTVAKYLTVEEANERIRTGQKCFIKCVLPILDLLPGITYAPGAWVPPLCAITAEP